MLRTFFDGTSNEVLFEGSSSFLDGVRKLFDPVVVPGSGQDETLEITELDASFLASEPTDSNASRLGAAAAMVEDQGHRGQPSQATPPTKSASRLRCVVAFAFDACAIRDLSAQWWSSHRSATEWAGPLASLFEGLASALRKPTLTDSV
jgi:hypothetical protein